MTQVQELQQHYNLQPQGPYENADNFRNRIARELRANGQLIEANEVLLDARFDDEKKGVAVQMGIIGDMLQEMFPRPPIYQYKENREQARYKELVIAEFMLTPYYKAEMTLEDIHKALDMYTLYDKAEMSSDDVHKAMLRCIMDTNNQH